MLAWLSKQQEATAETVESQARELNLLDWLAAEANVTILVIRLWLLLYSGLLPAARALL